MKSSPTRSLFGDISKQQFLAEYWQKKPLLIRGALTGFSSPITADELAGLACEDEVESRIVIEKGGNHPWELRHGPFQESDFSSLPESHWSLLLQEANKQIPELAELLDVFDFIPSWWLDDIMISYSPDQGTVGPHYDRYDVFLLQVEGRKNWQISTLPVDENNVIDDIELRIMKTFHSEQEWTLEAGDMLYLPPGVAHHGVAQGESLTYSIGYRALSQSELLASYFDFILEQHDGKRHFSDPALTVQQHRSEITPETIKKVTQLLQEMPFDSESVGRWFGRFATEPNQPMARYLPEQPLTSQQCLQRFKTSPLTRHAHCRFNFTTLTSGAINLFIDGDEYQLNPEQVGFGHIICDITHYCHDELVPYLNDPQLSSLLLRWVNDGTLYFTDE